MCGIAGFCNFKEDFEENTDYWNFRLEKMRAVLAHRGNDARGRYLKKHIGLSHSRLAIRDILCGDQPMTRTHNGYDYTICYNGEIYNTDELIPELSENGFVCSTTSDTEVILYAYIHWGADFVNRLNGILHLPYGMRLKAGYFCTATALVSNRFLCHPRGFSGVWLRAKGLLCAPSSKA